MCKKITNRINYSYQPADIIAFNKTTVWVEMVSDTTVDIVGKKQYEHNKRRKVLCNG